MRGKNMTAPEDKAKISGEKVISRRMGYVDTFLPENYEEYREDIIKLITHKQLLSEVAQGEHWVLGGLLHCIVTKGTPLRTAIRRLPETDKQKESKRKYKPYLRIYRLLKTLQKP
jgi:hypothetical protein